MERLIKKRVFSKCMFIKYIGSIVVLHLNKVQEKIFNFKTKKVQETTLQMKYQQKEIANLSS